MAKFLLKIKCRHCNTVVERLSNKRLAYWARNYCTYKCYVDHEIKNQGREESTNVRRIPIYNPCMGSIQ